MSHLNPRMLIAALDGALTLDQRAHVDACAECRNALAHLQATEALAHDGGPVPEPSPLFWDHFSARVRAATDEVGRAGEERWWRGAWKVGLAGALAVTLVWMAIGRLPHGVSPAADRQIAAEDAATWDDVVAEADGLSPEELVAVVPFAASTTVLVEDLSPRELDAFALLIERELGQVQ